MGMKCDRCGKMFAKVYEVGKRKGGRELVNCARCYNAHVLPAFFSAVRRNNER